MDYQGNPGTYSLQGIMHLTCSNAKSRLVALKQKIK